MSKSTLEFLAKIICIAFLGTVASSYADETKGLHEPPKVKKQKPSFTGAWSNISCVGADETACGGFIVYLSQDGNHLCGDHFYSTQGAGRLNEGFPRSIAGTVHGSIANLVITSGRDGSAFHAKIFRKGAQLHWERLSQVKQGQFDESLIPEDAILKKSQRQEDIQNLRRVIRECN